MAQFELVDFEKTSSFRNQVAKFTMPLHGWVQRGRPMNCLIDKIKFVAQSIFPFNKLLIEGIEALSLLFYVFFGV
jgi:hypothetical protein